MWVGDWKMLDGTEESEGHKMVRIQDIVGAWKR